jgi:urea carboxylase
MALETVEVPIAGVIISVEASSSSNINEGDVICLIESMKMENPILAPVSGVIREVQVSPGQSVRAGDVLAVIEY